MAFDPDTPEWTDDEIARGRPGSQVLPTDFVAALRRNGASASLAAGKAQVTLSLDREALDLLQADGPGWENRINEAVRKAAGL